jgi:hypothetical protein
VISVEEDLETAQKVNMRRPRQSHRRCHGPPSLTGGGFHHIYATMEAEHVQEIITEVLHEFPMGQLILISIKQDKFELK